jgi:hypothetical protein
MTKSWSWFLNAASYFKQGGANKVMRNVSVDKLINKNCLPSLKMERTEGLKRGGHKEGRKILI